MIAGLLIGARGAAYGLAGGFSPGPTLALVISQTLRFGLREGSKVAIAPLLTDAPIIALSWWLLNAMEGNRYLLAAVAAMGALVLTWFAFDCFKAELPESGDELEKPRSIWKGVLANGLNPHPYLFWMTVGGPALIEAWAQGPLLALLFLGLFYTSMLGSKLLIAVATQKMSVVLRDNGYRWVQRVLGAALLLFAYQSAMRARELLFGG